jgi:hypothetical protein
MPFIPCISLPADEEGCSYKDRRDCFFIRSVEDNKHGIIWGAKCVNINELKCEYIDGNEMCVNPVKRTDVKCDWDDKEDECLEGGVVDEEKINKFKNVFVVVIICVVGGIFIMEISIVIIVFVLWFYCENRKRKRDVNTSFNLSLTENVEIDFIIQV